MKLIDDLKDVFELALGVTKFVDELISSSKQTDSGQMANSGYYVQMANSGNYGKMANSGDNGKMANSGYSGQMANSGYYVQMANSGDNGQMANSGDNGKMANSGNYGKMANSGNYGQMANSGDNCVLANIGVFGTAKSKIGSWITLAYFKRSVEGKFIPNFVKTEYVDGVSIKEDTYYCLYKTEFREVLEVDGIKSAILSKKGNVYKVWNFGDDKESFVFEENGIFSHGKTLKEARESLIYKIGERDTTAYKDYTEETKVSKQEAIKMYRVITGACEFGVKRFVESQEKVKPRYKVKEIIELTKNQYGHEAFKKFFEQNEVNR